MSLHTDRRQGLNSSLAFKAPVRLATTANITLSGFQSIDGVLPTSDDTEAMRSILVESQTDAAENGVYVMDTGAWERRRDWDSNTDFVKGTRVYVHSGSTASGAYVLTSAVDDDFAIDTDDITFTASASVDINFGALTALTTPDPAADFLSIFDTSAGVNKKVTPANLFKYIGDGTAALPSVAFESDQTKGMYSLGTNLLGWAIAGAAELGLSSTSLFPVADTGIALGTTALKWAHLFLGSGGVINFNAGDVLITHGTNALAFTGASGGYGFDALVVPGTDDGAPLGSTSLKWSDLFLAAGGVINWAAGGVTINEISDGLSFAGASAGYIFSHLLIPSVSDGAALGNTSFMWSDVFLASGAVINFNVGDVTITHVANALSFAGASNGYAFLDGPITPGANDGSALGASTVAWSDLFLASGAVINFNNGNCAITHTAGVLTFSGLVHPTLAGLGLRVTNTTDSASVQTAIFEGDRATMADNDEAYISLLLSNDAGTQTEFARVTWVATDVNAGTSVDGALVWSIVTAGSMAKELVLDGAALWPFADDGLALGKSGNAFADLFLASGAVINFNAGDVTITHAANALVFSGASGGYGFDAVIAPTTNDGAPLGSTSLMWSDLFLASGAVVNFNNGDVTITHSADLLTLAGGNFSIGTGGVFTAGTIELGHASANTLSASGGVLSVEGNAVAMLGTANAFTQLQSIAVTANSAQSWSIANSSNGAAASCGYKATSDTGKIFNMGLTGSGAGDSGGFYTDAVNGMTFFANAAGGNIAFGAGGLTEQLRLTVAGNLKIGGTANRGTTEGTKQLVIFDGTAPAGTLANGISLYSASGECRVMDAAGNATTLSPHNFSLIPEGPSEEMAWSYYSERDGKRINIDMLKTVRLVERLSGERLVYAEAA